MMSNKVCVYFFWEIYRQNSGVLTILPQVLRQRGIACNISRVFSIFRKSMKIGIAAELATGAECARIIFSIAVH
ncbi:hypothetical protein [Noviherbaspirillum sedimenti]|uniref:hypothetical protein n=1 Tax=Noviherbaspirillum sedimenti TaxID=2320865 RepID=UPI001F20F53F|nr:hypothetical protein [Noviherbaspirillum sedimenti]